MMVFLIEVIRLRPPPRNLLASRHFEWQMAMSAVLSGYLATEFSESWTLMLVLELQVNKASSVIQPSQSLATREEAIYRQFYEWWVELNNRNRITYIACNREGMICC